MLLFDQLFYHLLMNIKSSFMRDGKFPCQCSLCGSHFNENRLYCSDFITKIKGQFIYAECSKCGSYTQYPIPSIEYLEKCYETQNLGYKKPTIIKKRKSIFEKIIQILEDLLVVILRSISSIIDTNELKPTLPPPNKDGTINLCPFRGSNKSCIIAIHKKTRC